MCRSRRVLLASPSAPGIGEDRLSATLLAAGVCEVFWDVADADAPAQALKALTAAEPMKRTG